MGFAISLRSDHPSAEAVRALWRGVERFEDRPSMASLGYPPHVTLAVYGGDGVGEAEVRAAAREAARGSGALTLAFDAVRSFAGPPLVLWASPRADAGLRALHAAVHALVDPARCHPYYRPEAWVPHCTLGTRIREDRREAALCFAAEPRDAFAVVFDALDCVAYPPPAPVETVRLPVER